MSIIVNPLQRWYYRWSRRLERYLFGLLLFLLLLLIAVQLAMTHDRIRYHLSPVEFNEGVPYRWPD
jgi:type II secretory pathway component PulF